MDLDSIPWRDTRYAGIAVHFYATDRSSGRVVALIRMRAGCGYPRHRHRGAEEVVVLQGSYHDEFGDHAAGTFVAYEDDSTHAPVAGDDQTCVLLAIAHEGVVLD